MADKAPHLKLGTQTPRPNKAGFWGERNTETVNIELALTKLDNERREAYEAYCKAKDALQAIDNRIEAIDLDLKDGSRVALRSIWNERTEFRVFVAYYNQNGSRPKNNRNSAGVHIVNVVNIYDPAL